MSVNDALATLYNGISNQYYNQFIPNQNNGDWVWMDGAGPAMQNAENDYADYNKTQNAAQLALNNFSDGGYGAGLDLNNLYNNTNANIDNYTDSGGGAANQTTIDPIEQWREQYKEIISPEGSGQWTNSKYPEMGRLDYRPEGSLHPGYAFSEPPKPTFANKFMPKIMMAAIGSLAGGAGAAMAGSMGAAAGSAGSLIGQGIGSAVPGMMQQGLNTGDWGKAATNGALSGLGSYLGGTYGTGDLSKAAIGTGVSTLGKYATGQPVDALSTLANFAGNYGSGILANQAGDAVGEGFLGDLAKSTTGSLSNTAIQSLLRGKTPSEQEIIMKLLYSAIKPTMNAIL